MSFILAILGGIAGAVAGWFLAAVIASVVAAALGVSNFEGAIGYLAVFGAGPVGALVGLVGGIWLVLHRHGRASLGSMAWRLPLALGVIAAITAGGLWVAYDMRPMLGTSSSGPPRLDFEVRLPPGMTLSGPPAAISVELSTERNQMPGDISKGGGRQDGDRQVITGSVELAYRSGWRLLELRLAADGSSRIFDLRLPARPFHMRDYGSWRRVDFIADAGQQPRKAPDSEAYELRSRVVYREEEHGEGAAN